MTLDEQREKNISDLNLLIEGRMAVWASDGCFHARGQAEGYVRARDELIRGRSVEQVQRMKEAPGLAA